MTDPTSDRDDLFAQWRKQVEAGTDAWIQDGSTDGEPGHVPPRRTRCSSGASSRVSVP